MRETWVEYCHRTGDTTPRHVAPWEALDEHDREADRFIGERMVLYTLCSVFGRQGVQMTAVYSLDEHDMAPDSITPVFMEMIRAWHEAHG